MAVERLVETTKTEEYKGPINNRVFCLDCPRVVSKNGETLSTCPSLVGMHPVDLGEASRLAMLHRKVRPQHVTYMLSDMADNRHFRYNTRNRRRGR